MSDSDETGKTDKIGCELSEIRGDDASKHDKNGKDDKNNVNDGTLVSRCSTCTNKGQITKNY